MSLADRMTEAAETLEEISSLYGYPFPDAAPWTARELRTEAPHNRPEGLK